MSGVLLGMLVGMSIEQEAKIALPEKLTAEEVKRVHHFIKTNNPLNAKSGELVIKQLSQRDLDILLNYITLKTETGVNRKLRVNVVLEDMSANVQASLQLPDNPLGEFVNISTEIVEGSSKHTPVELKSLKVGSIEVPVILITLFSNSINRQIDKHYPEYRLIRDAVKKVSFKQDSVTFEYIWSEQADRTLKTQIGLRMLSAELRQAIVDHANYLSDESYKFPEKPGLSHILNTMFSYAQMRSEQRNPLIENKAAFIAISAYSLKRNIPEMLGVASHKKARYRWVYLKGRHDLSKHFILSAAITSMADPEIAESIGVVKEVRDAKNGSGFSFADLAADHAGIRLVEEALRNEERARYFQGVLADIKSDREYMLNVSNLPEGIELSQFEKNYADTDSEEYQKVEKIIKERIDKLPIYNRLKNKEPL